MMTGRQRAWAEPLVVQHWSDYCAERGPELAAWTPIEMGSPRGRALIVLDGRHVLEMLDRFFGGDGAVHEQSPAEFTPAGETLVARIAQALAPALDAAWEPVAPIRFRPMPAAMGCHAAPEIEAGEAMIVTRFGLATDEQKPVHLDILYPVAALKPHGPSLTAKVQGKRAEVEPEWRTGLTRAAMGVGFPVHSVLAEPVIPLGILIDLKVGDVIPIEFGRDVPVVIAGQRLARGQVGTSNGRAAVKLTAIEPLNQEDYR
jgi:flagellar motor switch protein FliM